jgi:hypothetical protein
MPRGDSSGQIYTHYLQFNQYYYFLIPLMAQGTEVATHRPSSRHVHDRGIPCFLSMGFTACKQGMPSAGLPHQDVRNRHQPLPHNHKTPARATYRPLAGVIMHDLNERSIQFN